MMGQRGKQDWSKEPLPIGAIRIRTRRGGLKVRMVKVEAPDHEKGFRWVNYARWWWEQNRGPVPAGKRVCHLDGDSLNDDPSNYGLLTPGDVVFLCHERDPKMSERNKQQVRKATAAHNRLRGRVNRALHWLPTRWYAVDRARKLIYNDPHRSRFGLLRALGVPLTSDVNGRGSLSALFGWPRASVMGACVLDALADEQWKTFAEISEHVRQLRSRHELEPAAMSSGTFYSAAWALRQAGLIESCRRGRLPSEYRITAKALQERVPLSVIPLRGSRLEELIGEGFRRAERTYRSHIGNRR